MAFPHSDSEQCHENHIPDPPPNSSLRPQNPVDVIGVNARNPTRYVPLQHLYSATFSNKNNSNSATPPTKKAKQQPRVVNFYSRRVKKSNRDDDDEETELSDRVIKSEPQELDDDDDVGDGGGGGGGGVRVSTKRRTVKRRSAAEKVNFSNGLKETKRGKKRKWSEVENVKKVFSGSANVKRWVRLSFDDVDPNIFIGLRCKVYWPLDDDWYCGSVIGYQSDSNRHNVKYKDDDEEELILSNEKIKFHISFEDMQRLSLKLDAASKDYGKLDYDELVALAASLDDYQELEPGEIIWAKLSGHAMWPAIIMDEAHVGNRKGLNQDPVGRSVPVQFFGTHDFARIKTKQITPFLRGLLLSCHLKCKKPQFIRSLEEAKMYLSEQKISNRMLRLQNGIEVNDSGSESEEDKGTDSDEDGMQGVSKWRTKEGTKILPLVIGELEVTRLGKIVKDSDYFKDEKFIYPEGYKAVRKFTSITDQNLRSSYKMEVLRDEESKMQPIFRVTADNGKQFVGSTPSACWSKIYKKIRRMRNNTPDGSGGENGDLGKSGSYMFGFSNPQVFRLIKELASPKISSKFSTCKFTSKRCRNFPVGYRPVRVEWKDLDKCNVCHMDEEYENNLFLQCDKCRMMVHARCYGELEPVSGVLWLCNLCRPGAPTSPPPCCLCPVVGGAMKPTTDGRWAHLACAIWIPETCLSDVKLMEPIDGLSRINKDRWKLLCSICGVSYGACIQCSNNSCRVAYHPLCARAAGLCLELEDEDRVHFVSMDEDEENQCIRLFSFCKKHKQPSNCRSAAQDQLRKSAAQCSNYTPPSNPTGCARTEPYNYLERRGRKEPEALTASSSKRLFLENQPYLVSGYSQHESLNSSSTNALTGSKTLQLGTLDNILCVAEKYSYMRETFRKRLAFGKSRIHGFGIFAKHPHKAGDMMIEYTGELVRPSIADRREHFIYNSLVGAGTYMFRIDDERVIDATRAGSIAHLINHSCEPNCYSRVIRVNDDEHIIIFAKRDIKQWEELTYDYRFFSKDERLACYCGFPRCRGVVNDIDAEGRVAKLYVSRGELIDWRGE